MDIAAIRSRIPRKMADPRIVKPKPSEVIYLSPDDVIEAVFGKKEPVATKIKVTVECNSSAFVCFLSLVKSRLTQTERVFRIEDLGFPLARAESDTGSSSSHAVVRLYPSDEFMRFAADLFAGDFDIDTETGDPK